MIKKYEQIIKQALLDCGEAKAKLADAEELLGRIPCTCQPKDAPPTSAPLYRTTCSRCVALQTIRGTFNLIDVYIKLYLTPSKKNAKRKS